MTRAAMIRVAMIRTARTTTIGPRCGRVGTCVSRGSRPGQIPGRFPGQIVFVSSRIQAR
jgi:hypothetical protein